MFRKLSKTLAVLGTVGILAVGASFAQNETTPQPGQMGPGYGPMHHEPMGPGYGPMHHEQRGPGYKIKVDPQKVQAYCKEVQPLWQKLWQIRKELRELWSKNPPDWSAIEKKEEELVKLRLEMRKKAYEMGLPFGPKNGLRLRRICGW